MYKFAVLKNDSITNALSAFLKIPGILTGNICNGVRIVMGGVDWKAPITLKELY